MHQKVYVVVDDLDKYRKEGMAEFLRIIVRTGLEYSNVRWLLTSRPLDDADRELLTTTEQVGISLRHLLSPLSGIKQHGCVCDPS